MLTLACASNVSICFAILVLQPILHVAVTVTTSRKGENKTYISNRHMTHDNAHHTTNLKSNFLISV